MNEKMEAIRAKVKECIKAAEAEFFIKMPEVDVRFDLRGKAAGQACWRGTWGDDGGTYYLRFNRQHMAMGGKTWEHIIEDVVAHEVAHTVCQANPHLGKNHNKGWQRVCFALGGNGKRCYTAEDAPEAVLKQRPWVYITDNGSEVRVTPIIHKKIQRGAAYRFKHGMGSVNSECQYNYMSAPAIAANKAAQDKPVTKATPKRTVKRTAKAGSKAALVREHIAAGNTFEACVSYAVNELGMKPALAKTYVKNNWK